MPSEPMPPADGPATADRPDVAGRAPTDLLERPHPGTGDGGPPPDRGPVRRGWWVLRPLVIYALSRTIALGTLAVSGIVTHRSIAQQVDRWDGVWFLRAAIHGWPAQLPMHDGHVAGSTIAFFPLFPLTIRWMSQLTGLSPLTSGMLISELSGLTAMIGVWLLVRRYADQSSADRATLLVALFPGSFVLSLVYSEGLAITFLAFGLLALMRRHWLVAGVLGLLATATTPVALAFEVSCLWCAYRAIADDRQWRSLVAPVLTPLGFGAYQAWLWWHTGNPAAWRVTERGGWQSYPSLLYPVHILVVFLRDPIATTETGDILFVGTVVTVVAAVLAVRSRMPMPALLYGLSAAALGLVSAPIGMRPRFIFLAFPLVVALGTEVKGRAYVALVSLSGVLMVVALAYSVNSFRVFP